MSSRSSVWGAALVVFVAVLVCLIPKPENDLFFILRTGDDILRTRTLPHADTYSWTQTGTRWDVPEWGAFVLYSMAYKGGHFLGTWLLMATLTVAAALVVYLWVAKHAGVGAASALSVLTLLALSPFVQERPYAWTYLLLPVALIVLVRGRDSPRGLWALPVLCAAWANLHQGVLLFVGLLVLFGLWERRTLLLALICAAAVCVSPYGWGIYRCVFVTLRDPHMMANVTEWRPVWTVSVTETLPFWITAGLAGVVLLRAKRLPETLVCAALLAEGVLHARQTALFALAVAVLLAPLLPRFAWSAGARHRGLLTAFATLALLLMGTVTILTVRRVLNGQTVTPEHLAESVARLPRYPESACAFLDSQHAPANLRLLNSFQDGGFLMWRRHAQGVFIDGRLDLYAGRTFADNLVLETKQGTPQWVSLVNRYNFDAVLCTNPRTARAFSALPQYKLAFWNGKRQWVFLRREGRAKA